MGLKHEAKPGTVIEANGVKIRVLRGSPHLEITAPIGTEIKTSIVDLTAKQSDREQRKMLGRAPSAIARSQMAREDG